MKTKFKIGDLVRIKSSILKNRDEKYSDRTARIRGFYSDIKGGVILDAKVCGFHSWNVQDLVKVKEK